MYKAFFKRFIDFVGAVFLILLLWPILLSIFFVLKVYNKGEVFYNQKRPGKDEALFVLYKFKTMRDSAAQTEKERITALGGFLRRYSLDELPQLFNILKGDMSFIGPRPLLAEYLPLYADFQRKRHSMRPGITGWAQVNGRNSMCWDEKFKLDIFYVEHYSLWLDVKIALKTLIKVFFGGDIYTKTGDIPEKFTGNLK